METEYGSLNYEEPWISFVDPGNGEKPTIRAYNKYNFDKIEIEYVDLGLPSGNLWAAKNLGAETISGNGYFYSWGELTPKSTATSSNYRFGWPEISKYNYADGKYVLDSEDDVITQTYGQNWCMPTQSDCLELIQNVTYAQKTINNKTVLALTSQTNGNILYLPLDTNYIVKIWTSSCLQSSASNEYAQKAYKLYYTHFSERWTLYISENNRWGLLNIRGIFRPKGIITS